MVYVMRVEVDGEVVENERSQLQWTDEAGDHLFSSKRIRPDRDAGRYIDIALARTTSLQILSRKGNAGHRFTQTGTYTVGLCIETAGGRTCTTTLEFFFEQGRREKCAFVRPILTVR